MTKRMIIMLLLVGAVFGGIYWFQMFKAEMMAQFLAGNAAPPVTVTAKAVTMADWQPSLSAVGTLRAVRSVQISTEVPGLVRRVHFESGDVVKKGDVLIELHDATGRALLNALQAAERLAASSLNRNKQQMRVHAISQAQLDASEADLAVKQAQVKQQQEMIAQKSIRAPFSGRLGLRKIHPGQYLNPASPLVSLQDDSSMYVDFLLPQKILAEVKIAQRFSLNVNAYKSTPFSGQLTAINASVDASTRNVQVEGLVDNADGKLLAGMFVSLELNQGEVVQRLTLPQTAISFNAYGPTLFLAKSEQKDGKTIWTAQQVFIKTGERRGDQVAITKGVNEGAMVVTSGQMKLKNGSVLIIDNSITPSNDAAPMPQDV